MALTITTAVCDSFKQEVLQGGHLFRTVGNGGNTFKMCLLKAAASGAGTYGAGITNYGAGSGTPSTSNVGTDEAADTSGNAQYTAGGFTMATNAAPSLDTSNHVAYVDWATDPNWGPAATITSRGCVLYNTISVTNGNGGAGSAVACYDFGADKTCTTGTFTITLPAPAYNTAVLRLG